MTWIDGIDASFSRITVPDFQHLWSLGYRVFCQCLWCGGYAGAPGIRAVAEANLKDAEAAGFALSAYTNASPWFDGRVAIDEAARSAGSMWSKLRIVAVDVEIDSTPEAHIKQTCELLEASGRTPYIYSANWFWVGHLGNPKWQWLNNHKIWNADYDGSKNIDWNNPWGPWTQADIIGKQLAGTTTLATPGGRSVTVDLNVFDQAFFEEDDMFDQAARDRLEEVWHMLCDGAGSQPGDNRRLIAVYNKQLEIETSLARQTNNGVKARFGITTTERDAFITVWLSKVLDENIVVTPKDLKGATDAVRKLLAG